MNSIRIKTVVETDGELHVANLPCRKGDQVEAIVMLPDHLDDEKRKTAREQFLKHARASSFCSSDKYPSRAELHERH